MKLGEVCILTNDVIKMASFYKFLLAVDDIDNNDSGHQTLIAKETMLTIYNDGKVKQNGNQTICIAFTCDDIESEYKKLKEKGVEIITKPQIQPWGAVNMSFYDPDGNIVYLRQIVH